MASREDMSRFAREAAGLPDDAALECTALSARGSDRTFYRVTWDADQTCILIHYNPGRAENAYYAEITGFLSSIGVPAPRLIRHDPDNCLLLMEDMGNKDLWAARDAPWDTRRDLYRKTLVIVRRLHSFPEKEFPSDRVRLMEAFGPGLYQWEREYFKEHFVRGALGLDIAPGLENDIEEELSALAGRLSETPRCLVHRDLQSQNVMVRDGEPYLIDFQGMRFGSPFYDLGSLLGDPYVEFSVSEIEELLFYYYETGKGDIEWPAFQDLFWDASAQRLMQALGAYGFLGYKKGLTSFLGHIPAGLAHLVRATTRASALPLLKELSLRCRTKWRTPADPT
jgi:N-acetylmuramate 1-kinase